MIFGGVSLDHYNALVQIYNDTQKRYDDLLEKYHALRTAGANPEVSKPVVETREPDAVQYAISQRAGSNHALRLYLTGWAAKQRAANMDSSEIVNSIIEWQSDTDD